MLERREVLDNPGSERIRRVVGLSRRSARLRSGLIRIEGPQALAEALRQVPEHLRDVYVSPAGASANPELVELLENTQVFGHTVSERVAKALGEASQGWVGVASLRAFSDLEAISGKLALVLPATQDPGNVGTLIRLADACGASAVFLGRDSADATSPKVIRASVGSVFHLPIARFSSLEDLVAAFHDEGWLVAGTAPGASRELSLQDCADLAEKKVAWLMGNEAHGLHERELELCDTLFSIPMFGRAESLNVTQAATLTLWLTAHAQHRGA